VILSYGLEFIGFFYFWNDKNNFLMFLRGDSLELCQIISCDVSGRDRMYFKFENVVEITRFCGASENMGDVL
jgi:hypothetical protein